MQLADVILTDVNDEARISLLLDCYFATFLLGADLNAWLIDLDLLFIEIRRYFDHGWVPLGYTLEGVCYILLNVLNALLDVLVHRGHVHIFVDNHCDFGWGWQLASMY